MNQFDHIPVVDPRTFNIEQALNESTEYYSHADKNWKDVMKTNNKKNKYFQFI